MKSGMRFVLIGAVDEKRAYDDKKTGERKFGVQVSWHGGSEFFMMSAEQYKLAPEKDNPIQLEGTFKTTQFGVRYQTDTVSDPRVVASQAEPSVTSSRRATA